MMPRIAVAVLKILVSGTFMASALAKGADFTDTMRYVSALFHIDGAVARIGLSTIIGIEAGIAVMVLYRSANVFVFRSAVALLILFAVVNVALMMDGVANCGCMGTRIESAPAASLVKNMFLLAAMYGIHMRDNKIRRIS